MSIPYRDPRRPLWVRPVCPFFGWTYLHDWSLEFGSPAPRKRILLYRSDVWPVFCRQRAKDGTDRMEGVPVTNIYYGLGWISVLLCMLLMSIGLWNASTLTLSEKGFFGMAFILSLFAAITVQKNTRDSVGGLEPTSLSASVEGEIPSLEANFWMVQIDGHPERSEA